MRLDGGVDVVLGPVLAKAGEGTIFEVVDRPEWVAKVFHPTLTDLDAKFDKIAAMAASPPDEAVQQDSFVVLTWPLHVLAGDGGPVGYVMPRIDTTTAVEIHTLSNPSNRANPLPGAPHWPKMVTWFHLVNVAANLCLAVETAHRIGAVIGDFQERNILVADTTRVTLVDCDSMQFTDPSGRQFLCGVGRPEFTAPELAGTNLRTTARQIPSDLFALAVHIHLLLMAGNHPFLRGTWTGPGDQPDALTLAAAGHWAGGWQSPLHTHPLAPPPSFLPVDIQHLFLRAFTTGAHDPTLRPTATEWRRALLGIQVTSCLSGTHQIPTTAGSCPWCAIDDERAARKQVAHGPGSTVTSGTPADPRRAAAGNSLSAVQGWLPPGDAKLRAGGMFSRPRDRILLALLPLSLLGLLFVGLLALTGWGEPTAAAPSATPPEDAVQCPDRVVQEHYSHHATGTKATTCQFAESVEAALTATNYQLPVTVKVYSTVTNQSLSMRCAVERVVTCRGGDYVVYLY